MKKKQLTTMGVALGLTAAIGVGGTLAILSQTTGPVTNTFAVGVNIDESDFSIKENPVEFQDGDYTFKSTNEWISSNDYSNILPGATLDKNPTVIFGEDVTGKMADCYMFVYVQGIDALKAKGITLNDWGTKWKKVTITEGVASVVEVSAENATDGMYIYDESSSDVADYEIVPANNFKLDAVFNKLDVSTGFDMQLDENQQIKVWACAVQYDNVNLNTACTEADNKFTTEISK